MTEGQDPKNFPDLCPVHNIGCPSAGQEAIKGTKPKDVDPAALAQAQADMEGQEKVVGLIEVDLAAAKLAQAAYDDYTKQRQALADKVAKLKKQQEQALDTAAIDEQITTLDLRMKTGYELLDAVREFWRKKEAAEAVTAKVAQAEKEVDLYDALAKAMAPDGIPSQLIAEALGPVNERLALASGYLFPDIDEHAPVHLTEDLEVYRGGTPYVTLSKSARYRTGIAFQVVLAQLAKARLLIIDEADILDPPNRSQLIEFLLAVRQDFDTILVFATSQEAQPSPVPEIQIWWLEAGRINRMEVNGATHDQAAG
jgi:DNA repair exonuclease SbcCD ATPase subunit